MIFKFSQDNTVYQFPSTSFGTNCFLAQRLTSVLHDKKCFRALSSLIKPYQILFRTGFEQHLIQFPDSLFSRPREREWRILAARLKSMQHAFSRKLSLKIIFYILLVPIEIRSYHIKTLNFNGSSLFFFCADRLVCIGLVEKFTIYVQMPLQIPLAA